jgi:hypothetical protein
MKRCPNGSRRNENGGCTKISSKRSPKKSPRKSPKKSPKRLNPHLSGGSKESLRRLRMVEHSAKYRNDYKVLNHAERMESLKLYFPKLSASKAAFFAELEKEYGKLYNEDFELFLQGVKEVDDEIAKMPGDFESKKAKFREMLSELAHEFQREYDMEGAEPYDS